MNMIRSNKFHMDRVSENNQKNEDVYFISQELYDSVLRDMYPKEIIVLLGHANTYNDFYDYCSSVYSNINIAKVDANEIFKKVLESKDCGLINFALKFFPNYKEKTIEFLKKCNDDKFIRDFIEVVQIRWDPYVEFLRSLEYLDVPFLWKNFGKTNKISVSGGSLLFSSERLHLLNLMYFLGNTKKMKVMDEIIMARYFRLVGEEIKSIDLEFYNKLVSYFSEKDYEDVIDKILENESNEVMDDIQIGFDISSEHNSNSAKQEDSETKSNKDRILDVIKFVCNCPKVDDATQAIIHSYLMMHSEEIKEIDEDFYNNTVRSIAGINYKRLVDDIIEKYRNPFVCEDSEQLSFNGFNMDSETQGEESSAVYKKFSIKC